MSVHARSVVSRKRTVPPIFAHECDLSCYEYSGVRETSAFNCRAAAQDRESMAVRPFSLFDNDPDGRRASLYPSGFIIDVSFLHTFLLMVSLAFFRPLVMFLLSCFLLPTHFNCGCPLSLSCSLAFERFTATSFCSRSDLHWRCTFHRTAGWAMSTSTSHTSDVHF